MGISPVKLLETAGTERDPRIQSHTLAGIRHLLSCQPRPMSYGFSACVIRMDKMLPLGWSSCRLCGQALAHWGRSSSGPWAPGKTGPRVCYHPRAHTTGRSQESLWRVLLPTQGTVRWMARNRMCASEGRVMVLCLQKVSTYYFPEHVNRLGYVTRD